MAIEIEAPDKIGVIAQVMREHPEIDREDDEKRAEILELAIPILNHPGANKPWGRKARQKDGSNKNSDGLTFLRTDGKFEIIDVINGDPPYGASWQHKGVFYQGENGYWSLADFYSDIPDIPDEPIPDSATAAILRELKEISKVVDEIQSKVLKDGDKIAIKMQNGMYISFQDADKPMESHLKLELQSRPTGDGGYEVVILEKK